MTLPTDTWAVPLASLAAIALYLLFLAMRPGPHARHVHADLRAEWFDAVSAQAGTEVLAVQTLRNSVMSATMTASTAALGLMGAISLTVPSVHAALEANLGVGQPSPSLLLEGALMALLFATLVANVMAIRNYTHVGFVVAMPVGSEARTRWTPGARDHLRNAGMFYSWGLRCLVLVAPVLVSMLHPALGLAATLLAIGALTYLEKKSIAKLSAP